MDTPKFNCKPCKTCERMATATDYCFSCQPWADRVQELQLDLENCRTRLKSLIENQQELPAEFAEIIDKHFDELTDKEQ